MRILIVGANGRTGRHIMSSGVQGLVPFVGDILDADAVDKGVRGVDAVVSVVGHVKGSFADVQTKGMENIVAAMKKYGVKRIVSLTGTGVRLPDDQITLADHIMNSMISVIDPARVKDGYMHAKVLQNSGLDWTIVRVLKLTNSGKTTNWQLASHGPTKTFTSRRDVADAILSVVEDSSFIGEMPMLVKSKQ